LERIIFIVEFFSKLTAFRKANVKVKQSATGLEWLRGLQKVKVPRFHDNGTGWW